MAKAKGKKEFDRRMSGTINSIKDKDKKPTKRLRGNLYDENDNELVFTGEVNDSDPKKMVIDFTLMAQENSDDVFATQRKAGEGRLKFNSNRTSDKAPDWRSADAVKINGKQYRISCWTRTSEHGKFLSVALQHEDDYQTRIAQASGEAAPVNQAVSAAEAGL